MVQLYRAVKTEVVREGTPDDMKTVFIVHTDVVLDCNDKGFNQTERDMVEGQVYAYFLKHSDVYDSVRIQQTGGAKGR